jgi:Na+/melibiose symporter-like transporter
MELIIILYTPSLSCFYLGLTIFSVPYVAMGYEMSDDFHERTNGYCTMDWSMGVMVTVTGLPCMT